ncbi:undecaprenyldiphospho-muramoylpentapeptide beta-N-acetylglucosaminyltransferase [Candidatus Bipolaricaulota bacterium]|nr:undecaprenyldiphospho-muramoylpentapeptide beta-N-acetylglucosaminyltransferase [Candidatus Bipolaricaulota bacterium]
MRVLVAGGGTGGHVYPALAILDELAQTVSDVDLGYVGTKRGLEARLVPSISNVQFFTTCVRGFPCGSRVSARLKSAAALLWALVQAFLIVLRFRPHVVLGVGGYASFPVVFVSALLGRALSIRTLIHEQNAVVGRANRVLARWVDRVLVSFPSTVGDLPHAKKIVITGNPVRQDRLGRKPSRDTYREFSLDPDKRTVLVFGGSKGSAALTQAVLDLSAEFLDERAIQVLLVTGSEGAAEEARNRLRESGARNFAVQAYIDQMGKAYAIADLVVSRAGATTLAEITSCGKPAVIVPWEGAADDHQVANAQFLEQADACALIREAAILDGGLSHVIRELVRDPRRLVRMAANSRQLGRRQATTAVLGEVVGLFGEALT